MAFLTCPAAHAQVQQACCSANVHPPLCTSPPVGDLPYPELEDDFTTLRPAPTRGSYTPLPATAPPPAAPEQP